MLVDKGSLVNIIYGSAYDKMEVDHELTLVNFPLYGFTGDNILPSRKITLATEMGIVAHNFMEFIVVDRHSAYHGVLGRPILKKLWVVTSIHYLCMKFPTEWSIAIVRGDQRSTRECYSSSVQKNNPPSINAILMEIDEVNDPVQKEDVNMVDTSEEEAIEIQNT